MTLIKPPIIYSTSTVEECSLQVQLNAGADFIGLVISMKMYITIRKLPEWLI
jgi:hypothetical protein